MSTRRLVDTRLAFALPWLVVIACLMLVLGLALEVYVPELAKSTEMASWFASGVAAIAAFFVLARALKREGRGVAIAVAAVAVVSSVAIVWGVSLLLRVVDGADLGVLSPLLLVPGVSLVLLGAAVAVARPALRGRWWKYLGAWVLAAATLVGSSYAVGYLSDRAGHAGMDAIALFILPPVAVLVWWVAVAVARIARGARRR